MYILSISKKAFIRFEEDKSITIVSMPEKATRFKTIGDAMRIAAQVNEDFEIAIVKVISLYAIFN